MRNTNMPPCQNCPNRVLACHEHCKVYGEWKTMYERGKKKYSTEVDSYSIERGDKVKNFKILKRKRGRPN